MVDRDIEEGRITRALIGEELHLPKYPDLTSAPNTEGLSVLITGGGDDPAGTYTYANSQWSGPAGGPSNLPDTTLGQDESVPNTEQYSFGEYLRGSVDPENGKHVVADLDTDTADERYFRIITDSFDGHAPTDPTQDPPTTPQTWRFESGVASTEARGGYYSTDTPPSTQSARSFGVPFANTTAPDGRSISARSWALSKEYAVGAGGETLTVGAWAQPNATYSGYDDGVAHSEDETYIGEDDMLVGIECYDSSLQAIALDITTEYSRTASHQYFAAGETDDLTSQQWVRFSHEATLPTDTAYVVIRLQAVDKSNTWGTRGQSDLGNAAILVDDYTVSYTSGLAPSTVVSHDHDGEYAAESAFEDHTTNTNNPHQVTAQQAGAIPNQNGAVAESNLGFDTATQQELNQHTDNASAHHSRRTDAEVADALAGQSIGDNSPLSSINTDDLIVGSENTVSSFGNGIAVDSGALTSPDQPTSDLQWTLVGSGRTGESTGVVGLNWDKLKLVVHTDAADAASGLFLRINNSTVPGACYWHNQDGSTGGGGRFQLFTTALGYKNVSGTFELVESYNRANRGHTITGQVASRDRDVTYLRDGYANVNDVGDSINSLAIQPTNAFDMKYEVWGRDMPA